MKNDKGVEHFGDGNILEHLQNMKIMEETLKTPLWVALKPPWQLWHQVFDRRDGNCPFLPVLLVGK